MKQRKQKQNKNIKNNIKQTERQKRGQENKKG